MLFKHFNCNSQLSQSTSITLFWKFSLRMIFVKTFFLTLLLMYIAAVYTNFNVFRYDAVCFENRPHKLPNNADKLYYNISSCKTFFPLKLSFLLHNWIYLFQVKSSGQKATWTVDLGSSQLVSGLISQVYTNNFDRDLKG